MPMTPKLLRRALRWIEVPGKSNLLELTMMNPAVEVSWCRNEVEAEPKVPVEVAVGDVKNDDTPVSGVHHMNLPVEDMLSSRLLTNRLNNQLSLLPDVKGLLAETMKGNHLLWVLL